MKGYYNIKTYGCQMNVHESEKLAGMLQSLGYEPTDDESKADIILFNTCAIRDGVEQKVFGHVGNIKKYKKQNPNLIVAVCGCMTQIKGRADIFKQKYPFVNIIFGTHNINQFKNYLLRYENFKQNIYEIWDTEKEVSENVEMYRISNYNAWVNIMYGCNNFCTFCIVPHVRGRERSRNLEEIILEVKELVGQGFKYITLLGQNVNSYGSDFKDENISFAKLLEALANLDGDFKIKFLTSHPKDLTSDVIEVIARYDKISKAIHLPVQSGSSKILRLMNRRYTKQHYIDLINEVKSKIPNVFISTDIIVGFPNETEEDFNETYKLVEDIQYDGIFAFMYSPRSGTIAEKMENQVDKEVKKQRVNKILQLSKSIVKQKTQLMVNRVYDVIVEGVACINDEKYIVTTTDGGKSIYIPISGERKVEPSSFKKVKVTKYTSNHLFGEFI